MIDKIFEFHFKIQDGKKIKKSISLNSINLNHIVLNSSLLSIWSLCIYLLITIYLSCSC